MLNLDPTTIITRIIILIIAFSVHEFAHAYVANAFGDDTPRLNGRLTLNPAVHLDLMGSLMLLVAGFGWARPVPVNPAMLRRNSSAALMWVSLAGPLSNFVMAVAAAIPLRLGLVPLNYSSGLLPSLYSFLIAFIIINLSLMLFNLIPVAPLDGEKVAEYFLPPAWQRGLERISPYGPLILMALFFLPSVIGFDLLGSVMTPVLINLMRLLLGVTG